MNQELPQKLQEILLDREHGATYIQEKILEYLVDENAPITKELLNKLAVEINKNFPAMVQMRFLSYKLKNTSGEKKEILEIKTELVKKHKKAIKKCVDLLKKISPQKIATISHSSMVISSLIEYHKLGVDFTVTVGEGKPAREGKITAQILRSEGIKAYICKDENLSKISRGKNLIIIGCDAAGKEWITNKVGSYELVIVGGLAGVPTVLCGTEDKVVRPEFFGYKYDTDFLREFKNEITEMQMEIVPTSIIWKKIL